MDEMYEIIKAINVQKIDLSNHVILDNEDQYPDYDFESIIIFDPTKLDFLTSTQIKNTLYNSLKDAVKVLSEPTPPHIGKGHTYLLDTGKSYKDLHKYFPGQNTYQLGIYKSFDQFYLEKIGSPYILVNEKKELEYGIKLITNDYKLVNELGNEFFSLESLKSAKPHATEIIVFTLLYYYQQSLTPNLLIKCIETIILPYIYSNISKSYNIKIKKKIQISDKSLKDNINKIMKGKKYSKFNITKYPYALKLKPIYKD